ncbi:YetF domain-containing protein [Granulicella sp. dw_53]|uniref:DUF421 domain-containing protein n=1 Tax=Granulicella sp. dw_53 TaxID=2719792 RepID=UPI001BD4E34A|nr:YetF domain-containing protein [Granulicella sp. dw_53]
MITILYAVAGYFFLLLTVRVLARRPGAQLTMFEFVLIFLMGGVIIAATAANDRSLTNCTCAVIAVGLVHRMVAMLKARYPKLGAVVDGVPLVLRERGEWKEDVMRKMRMAPEDVAAAGRAKGIRSIDQIDYAILERSGEISTIRTEEK